jgi:trimethylguanosine synthase
VGGSAIGFALEGKRVLTTDIDPEKLRMAKHNAEIYGVAAKIEFRLADCIEVLGGPEKFDAVNLDPPWGGPDYWQKQKFELADFRPNGNLLLDLCLKREVPTALGLPKNFDQDTLGFLQGRFRIEPNYLDNQLLFYTLYIAA